ncbi:MAG: hypothetical protein AAFP79_16160 [Pseudomonadota bacterium]
MRKTSFKGATLALVAMGALATVAQARPIDEDNFIEGKETILDDKGYLLLTMPTRWAGTLIKEPNEEDIARYQEAYEEAFAEATERYEKDYARYRKRLEKPKTDRPMPKEPVQPVREEFRIVPIEQFMAIDFGPDDVFSKGDGTYTYLEEIEPGMYTWYGPVFLTPGDGYVGQCYCMGTIKFEVRAGEITNLGNSLYAMPKWEEDPTAPPLDIVQPMAISSMTVKLPEQSEAVTYDVAPSLQGQSTSIPEFFAVGKINNFYRKMISRMAPIEGVLAYDRDRVIDVKAELAAKAKAEAEEPAALEPGWITDGA